VSRLVNQLNEILADEWACVRTLRRAEALCDDPGKREVIKRVRKDCSVNCVSLTNAIRSLGGRPTDIPSGRFSLKLSDESLADSLDLAQSTQEHIIAEIDTVIDDSEMRPQRDPLLLVRKLHVENIRWLKSAISPTA
jgi:bacterioferritin (cytochrome b1)